MKWCHIWHLSRKPAQTHCSLSIGVSRRWMEQILFFGCCFRSVPMFHDNTKLSRVMALWWCDVLLLWLEYKSRETETWKVKVPSKCRLHWNSVTRLRAERNPRSKDSHTTGKYLCEAQIIVMFHTLLRKFSSNSTRVSQNQSAVSTKITSVLLACDGVHGSLCVLR